MHACVCVCVFVCVRACVRVCCTSCHNVLAVVFTCYCYSYYVTPNLSSNRGISCREGATSCRFLSVSMLVVWLLCAPLWCSGVDDMLPIFCYIILRSGLPQMISECSIMDEFIQEGLVIISLLSAHHLSMS